MSLNRLRCASHVCVIAASAWLAASSPKAVAVTIAAGLDRASHVAVIGGRAAVAPTPVGAAFVNTPPVITTQPSNAVYTTTTGGPPYPTFTVVANGTPTPTYQWQVSTDSGATWGNIDGSNPLNGYNGVTTPTLTISQVFNGYQYRVMVTNIAGAVTSNAATLTVQVPVVMTQPSGDATVAPGQNATFSVGASGTPVPTDTWQVSTDNGATWTTITNSSLYTIQPNTATSPTFTTLTVINSSVAMNAYPISRDRQQYQRDGPPAPEVRSVHRHSADDYD